MEEGSGHWKFGIFYFNPQDRRMLVPKRVKEFGITFNFAHPMSLFVIALTLFFLFLLARL